jgi:hypothetical protein
MPSRLLWCCSCLPKYITNPFDKRDYCWGRIIALLSTNLSILIDYKHLASLLLLLRIAYERGHVGTL